LLQTPVGGGGGLLGQVTGHQDDIRLWIFRQRSGQRVKEALFRRDAEQGGVWPGEKVTVGKLENADAFPGRVRGVQAVGRVGVQKCKSE